MKKLCIFLALVLLAVCLVSCTGSDPAESASVTETEAIEVKEAIYFPEKVKNPNNNSAMLAYHPDSIPDMFNDSDAVVLCKVTKSDDSRDYPSGNVISFADAEVIEVYKGDVEKGGIIGIDETGTRHDDGSDFSIGGEPLLRKDMKVLLFLKGPSTEERGGEESYGIKGCFFGKFYLDENNIVYPSSYFSSHAYKVPGYEDDYVDLDSFVKLMQK